MNRITFSVEADRECQLDIVNIEGLAKGFRMSPNAAGPLSRRLTEAAEHLLINCSAPGAKFH